MKRLTISLAVAALAILAVVATVAAASPAPTRHRSRSRCGRATRSRTILGLSQAEVMELRQDGLTLAQIAERQKVDPQKLIDALVAQWSARIDARVANGAITTAEAATLKAQLAAPGEGDGQPGDAGRDARRGRRRRARARWVARARAAAPAWAWAAGPRQRRPATAPDPAAPGPVGGPRRSRRPDPFTGPAVSVILDTWPGSSSSTTSRTSSTSSAHISFETATR